MVEQQSRAEAPTHSSRFVCPGCRAPLRETGGSHECASCSRVYPIEDGLSCFTTAPSSHGEFSTEEMGEFLHFAKERGWRRALTDYALPRRARVPALLLDERRSITTSGLRPGGRVLDLGCGYGGVALQLARGFDEVVALDGSRDRVQFLNIVKQQEGHSNIVPVAHNDILRLPFADAYFDAVVLVGVFEYFPVSLPSLSVEAAHDACLAEISRVLRPGGELLVATKNRYGIDFLRGMPDHNGMPFGPLLPRPLADLLLRARSGRPYRVINYSRREYRRLLERAGYDGVRFFWPFPGYQAPEHVVPLAGEELARFVRGNFSGWKRQALGVLHRLGLLRSIVNHFVILAEKPKGPEAVRR